MNVINQSAEIVDEVMQPNNPLMLRQIEKRGRVCYKSEDKITDESAPEFVSKVVKRAHNSVLEMGVIVIDVELTCEGRKNCNSLKYLSVGGGMTSGSIRAWWEYFRKYNEAPQEFFEIYPEFFEDFDAYFPAAFNIVDMPTNNLLHTYVCVKIITNRAVTHEIVRHRPCSFLQESQRYVRYDTPEGIEFIRPVWHGNDAGLEATWRIHMEYCEHYYREQVRLGLTPQQARGGLPNDTKTEIFVYANLQEWLHIFFLRSQGGADPQIIDLMKPLLEDFRAMFPGTFDVLKPSVG